MAAEELGGALVALLRRHELAGSSASIEGLRRLSGGASRETWSFDLVDGPRRRELILQRFRPGALSDAGAMATEADLLRAAGRHGVPVPVVLAHDDGTVLGSAGMVVERLRGETIPRKLLRDEEWSAARARLGDQAAEALAAIHAIPPESVAGLAAPDQLDQLTSLLDGLGDPRPAFELGIRWLAANRPASRADGLVHGDFRLGNLLVDHDGLRAVLDWELAHRGDPDEDLGWFCVRAWRFGSSLEAGGVAPRDAFLARYGAAADRSVDPEAVRWWEVLGTLKWGVICILQANGHLRGMSRSVELAAIGRRVCENEWDLLVRLPGAPLPVRAAPEAQTDPGLHGRPTAAELVEAVREYLDADVRGATEGRVAFHARVAVNALQMVERELTIGPALAAAHADRLAALGCADDTELAARIRTGALDDEAEELRLVVAASVHDKLLVANPAWL